MVLDYVILFILICVFIILVWILKHSNSNNKGLLHLSEFENKIGQFDTSFRDEFSRNRRACEKKSVKTVFYDYIFRACEKKSVNSVFYDYIFTYPAL